MSLYEYLSNEGRPHYNTEQDLSNPLRVDQFFYPLFMTTNETKTTSQKVYNYISNMFRDKSIDFINEMTELVLSKMRDNHNASIQEIVQLSIEKITITTSNGEQEEE